jgi:16S rRNA (adenine1518-N6/adenine1519-N6)-dimethyltransferase
MRNMSMLETAKLILRTHRIHPNILLGQNFMIQPSTFEIMSDYASLGSDDVVLDVGAGLGFLTRFLANKCKEVLAVEIDNQLVRVLVENLKDLSNVTVIAGNILRTQVPQFNKTVSIPPYQISSSFVRWLLERQFVSSVLIFQEEFAKHLVAPVGSEDYGWLTVFTYYRAECELLDRVPNRVFYPRPNVDSTIVRLRPKNPRPFTVEDDRLFIRFVQAVFTHRNRKVLSAVRPFLRTTLAETEEHARIISRDMPFRDERVRQLAPEDFGVLANALFG